jgi:hypothetical protein
MIIHWFTTAVLNDHGLERWVAFQEWMIAFDLKLTMSSGSRPYQPFQKTPSPRWALLPVLVLSTCLPV